jgi:enoyl-CoA hydratase/carnithine racemase
MARVYASLDRLNRSDKAVVTAVNGLALGMGCVFALACDVRLISEDQQIGLPESALGMLAGAGGAHRLTRMIGTGRAAELLLDGRWLTAQQAVELGLVHRAVPRHELQGEAHRVAERLAARSPVVRREIKRAVYGDGRRWPMREAAGLIATLTSPEARRQLASYESYLAEHHENLTDEVIIDGWHRLLDNRPALARIG